MRLPSGRKNSRRGLMRWSGHESGERQAGNDRAFAGARDGVAGTGTIMRQDVRRVGRARGIGLDVHPQHRQELPGRPNLGGLLQRPEQRLDLGGTPPLLHAGVFVLRVGGGLAGLQVRLVERFGELRGGVDVVLLVRGRPRRDDLTEGVLEPRACFLATLLALGPAQDPGAVVRVRMVPSQVVLTGGVASVSAFGIEYARRGHQEDAEQDATRARTNEAHESCSSMGVKVPPPISAVNNHFETKFTQALRGSIPVRGPCTMSASRAGYFPAAPEARSRARPIFCVAASILSTTMRRASCRASASRSRVAWTTAGNGHAE